MENEEKRMLGDYEVRQSIHIGKKEVVFGVNEADQYPFMVCYCTYDNPLTAAWVRNTIRCCSTRRREPIPLCRISM